MIGTENDITDAIKKLHSISLNPLITGLNSSEYFLLKILIRLLESSSNNSVHVSDITKKLNISAPSVTKILNGLEKRELITREIDKQNRRNTLVCITEKGTLLKKQNDLNIARLMTNVYNNVGRENIIQFLHLSDLIHRAIDDEIEKFENNKTINGGI